MPIFSLYSETREPTQEMLDLIDVLVIDLQDVGARIYTFIYTMANCLRAAARHGVPVIVCDRPNPIGGGQVEGPTLEPGFESFVGQFRMPMRHGMTIAELARLFNEHHGIDATLEVVPMEGWSRDMYWDETDLPWVMPSPNMPTLDTAIVYPGTVLYEGTMLSEGRGTTRPFELIGAPWLDGDQLRRAHEQGRAEGRAFPRRELRADLPEARARDLRRLPDSCHEPRSIPAGEGRRVAAPRMLRLGAGPVPWRDPPYEYEHDKMPIDILAGSPTLRQQIESQVPLADIVASWRSGVAEFQEIRRNYLLY